MLSYQSIAELVEAAEKEHKKISEIVLPDQAQNMGKTEQEVYDQMNHDIDVMLEAVEYGKRKDQKSTSGLTGGEGFRMETYSQKTKGGLSGDTVSHAMMRALAVAGCNASMGRIVASPTAGSCGIMPGCLLTLMQEKGYDRKDVVMSMFTAAAFGIVIATNASIAGAQGGCQAECGSASGMTAAAMVELAGGTPQQCADACAIAIANQLGLVCDPVAGLVEIPCIKRNASGVVIAFSSADMALAGIKAYVPIDECIAAMNSVGNSMPTALRETAKGGLAVTPTGLALKEKVFGKE
ncbi:MAG: L-serine ammonia-lyase, iron-sulfur-dependent, subunit alpha [Acidaminococcus sp.]|jgi:L-serine dehydratase|nr:L-serine ammonia-lyase, iron-sulfur-dependent, subunit alpha [Acidaminococcus sp.]MCI2099548.1 L-serine ammonia-lyase, iron-sulfur-dependent, subunit alpha [Acidaminococcus sp.]MCI2113633.1 L-serine ammonia-lyase, iron-sulfur-dependent, subunit alpha [Acidaminococcus sp.]MCI2115716.1 L-serine ammonia-lyase, iron-sulfur-dependent, subunit alpha [Acidaminococcus sp.]